MESSAANFSNIPLYLSFSFWSNCLIFCSQIFTWFFAALLLGSNSQVFSKSFFASSKSFPAKYAYNIQKKHQSAIEKKIIKEMHTYKINAPEGMHNGIFSWMLYSVCIFLCFSMHTFLISQGYSIKIYLEEVESHLFFVPNHYKKNLKPIITQIFLVFWDHSLQKFIPIPSILDNFYWVSPN